MRKQRREEKPAEGGAEQPGGLRWGKLGVVTALIAGLTTAANFLGLIPKVLDGLVGAQTAVYGFLGWNPYSIELQPLRQLPHSLLHVMPSNESLHWFRLQAENRGRERLHLVVEVEVLSNWAKEERARVFESTLEPGEHLNRIIQPLIQFLRSDFTADEVLRIVWRAKTQDQKPLNSDTLEITLLPKNTVYWDLQAWDLQGAGQKPVSPDLLVASLAAWILTPDAAVEHRAREILRGLGQEPNDAARGRRWMERAYESLFSGPDAVKVRPAPEAFPSRPREVVRTPAQVMARRQATSLEAVLVLAALRRSLGSDLRTQLRLLALPASEQAPAAKLFLLAWSVDGREWEAIQTNGAGTLPFRDNLAGATARVRETFAARPEVGEALGKRGVFVDEKFRLVALSFWQAKKHYNIRPLP